MKIVFQDDAVERFIAPRTMGAAGASDNKDKFGYLAYRELKMRGYTLYPINSSGKTIDRDKCLHSVFDLPPEVNNLLIILPSALKEGTFYPEDSVTMDHTMR
jgi:predicted CoA-binding protein